MKYKTLITKYFLFSKPWVNFIFSYQLKIIEMKGELQPLTSTDDPVPLSGVSFMAPRLLSFIKTQLLVLCHRLSPIIIRS